MQGLFAPLCAAGLFLGLTSPTPLGGRSIEWANSYDAALQAAADQERVLFVAVNVDGERANDRMAEVVYKDRGVVSISGKTVNLIGSPDLHKKSGKCPRFGCASCDVHRRAYASICSEILKMDDDGSVVAPQHVWLSPGGDVLLSVPYEVTADELTWCFHEAMAIQAGVEPEDRRSAGRRPRRLIVGDVIDPDGDAAPITREEALTIIQEHKKGGTSTERVQMIRRLCTADEPEARAYVLTVLRADGGRGSGRGGGGGAPRANQNSDRNRTRLLRRIGEVSPVSYWEVCAEFADSGSESVQKEAIVALEQLGADDSLPMLMKALRRASTDPQGQEPLVRAIGAVARGDKKARTALLRASTDKKNEGLRANAIISLGWLDADEDVAQRLLEAALPEEHGQKAKIKPDRVTPRERLGAVVAMGISRDAAWSETLQSIVDDGLEPEDLRRAAKASLAVIDGAGYALLRDPMTEAGGDEIPRNRLFSRKPRRND